MIHSPHDRRTKEIPDTLYDYPLYPYRVVFSICQQRHIECAIFDDATVTNDGTWTVETASRLPLLWPVGMRRYSKSY